MFIKNYLAWLNYKYINEYQQKLSLTFKVNDNEHKSVFVCSIQEERYSFGKTLIKTALFMHLSLLSGNGGWEGQQMWGS